MMRPGSWPSLILLYLYGVVATSLVTQSVPVIADMAKQFALGSAASGWVISVPSLVTAIAAVFGGWLIDRVGDKRVIFAGSLFALAGNVIVFFSHTGGVLFTGRLVEGVGYLSLTVGAVTMMMRTTSGPRRAVALGVWASHTAVGVGLTLTIIAPLAGHGQAWRWAFGGHAVLMALLAIAAVFLPGRTENDAPARKLADIWAVLKSLPPYRVALASGFSAFIQTGIMNALTVYLTASFGVSVKTAAGVGTIAEVFVVVGSLSAGYLLKAGVRARRIGVTAGVITLAGGVALYLPATGFAGACVAVCVFSLGIGTVNGLIWTFVPGAAPSTETLGATSGLVSQATYLGVLLGPPAIFASFFDGGWVIRLVLVIVAVVLQVVLLPFAAAARTRAARTPEPSV
ncbi:CynX/NimT family MFS transporter [Amycolatopsis acidicola]|nr:MFS transporter [Amycolatopsis acidicola]